MLCASVISQSPAASQVRSCVSTMKVLIASSNWYAWAWNHPCGVSMKSKVKASKVRGVPSQT